MLIIEGGKEYLLKLVPHIEKKTHRLMKNVNPILCLRNGWGATMNVSYHYDGTKIEPVIYHQRIQNYIHELKRGFFGTESGIMLDESERTRYFYTDESESMFKRYIDGSEEVCRIEAEQMGLTIKRETILHRGDIFSWNCPYLLKLKTAQNLTSDGRYDLDKYDRIELPKMDMRGAEMDLETKDYIFHLYDAVETTIEEAKEIYKKKLVTEFGNEIRFDESALEFLKSYKKAR